MDRKAYRSSQPNLASRSFRKQCFVHDHFLHAFRHEFGNDTHMTGRKSTMNTTTSRRPAPTSSLNYSWTTAPTVRRSGYLNHSPATARSAGGGLGPNHSTSTAGAARRTGYADHSLTIQPAARGRWQNHGPTIARRGRNEYINHALATVRLPVAGIFTIYNMISR
jgi:hypothetical protein